MGIFIYIRAVSLQDFLVAHWLSSTLSRQGPDQGDQTPHATTKDLCSQLRPEIFKKKRRIGRIEKKKKNCILCAIHTHSHIYTHTQHGLIATQSVFPRTLIIQGKKGSLAHNNLGSNHHLESHSAHQLINGSEKSSKSNFIQHFPNLVPHGTLAFGAFTYKYPPELVVYLASSKRFGSEMLGISCQLSCKWPGFAE